SSTAQLIAYSDVDWDGCPSTCRFTSGYCVFLGDNLLSWSSTAQLIAYSDVDWDGCPSTCRFTSGYCVFLGDNLLSWSAKRQNTLSRSSVEVEYRGVANAIAETA
nr:ribonuclease H-like domain-containing protein [Tanacetum cinerariifolium]